MSTQNEISIKDAVQSTLPLKVYGRVISPNLTVVADASTTVAPVGEALHFVSVTSFSFGTWCRRLPTPILLALPGKGHPPGPGDTCATAQDLVWHLPFGATSSALLPSGGLIEDLLDEAEARGIDGGIRLENPRIENGKACVDVHVWAKIRIFGRKIEFNERFPICVPLEGCQTVWDIAWARLEVCVRAPNQLCAKLCVGKWGLEKCWDACASLPLARSEAKPACGCQPA